MLSGIVTLVKMYRLAKYDIQCRRWYTVSRTSIDVQNVRITILCCV